MERPTEHELDEGSYCQTCWCIIPAGAPWVIVSGKPQCQACAYEVEREAARSGR